ncbi:MAG: carbohydrate ABC transporter permease [Anaerolineae bacterium]|nr:carbohydrate ABC transporter permease [Anaerolineae bacterium]
MSDVVKRDAGWYLTRFLLYALLTGFGFLMLFPFLYMLFTSFKLSTDVFHYPPRLLPYSPITVDYNGSQAPEYSFQIDGQERKLVPNGEKMRFGFFTSRELINADDPRSSEIVIRAQIEDEVDAKATGEKVIVNNAKGEPQSFDEYEVIINGEAMKLLLAYRGSLDVFVDPNDASFKYYAVLRTAQASEEVQFQVDNYSTVLGRNPAVPLSLDHSFVNTVVVTTGVVIGQLITSIFGGYAFSRVKFRGRDALFVAYLGSIMIPFVVLIIPMYRLMVAIGWQNRLVSLVVPWIFTAYGTFLMRQFFMGIPKELEEAALMDGVSRFGILWRIFVPLSTPAIATLTIFSFLYAWNSFLWPLLIIGEGNEANHVLTLSLIRLSNAFNDQPNLVLTGAAVAIIPPILIFVLAQRYFIEGVAASGMK